MRLTEKAYKGAFPEKEFRLQGRIRYSGRFSAYNANVSYRFPEIVFSLSRSWKGVSSEIVIGLLQHLMRRLWKDGVDTDEQDMYDIFLKKVHKGVERKPSPPELVESFNRVNEEYLVGMMDMPNLEWGSASFRKLGSYHYGSDRITLSTILHDELLDYVMYHELLHKKHQYKTTNGRSLHHSKAFKQDEARFKDAKRMETELNSLGRKKGWKARFLDF